MWQIKNLAGEVVGFIEEVGSGCGGLGWIIAIPLGIILFGIILIFGLVIFAFLGWILLLGSTLSNPSIGKLLLLVLGIVALVFSILTYLDSNNPNPNISDLILALGIPFFYIGGIILGIVFLAKKD